MAVGAEGGPERAHWHAHPVEFVADALRVDPGAGLDEAEVLRRRREFGPNLLVTPERWVRLRMIRNQFRDLLVWLLFIAAVVSGLLLGAWVDAGAIGAIVVLNAVIGYYQEARARTALDELAQLEAPTTRALRGGTITDVSGLSLVPGDVVVIEAGDRVPADGRVVEAFRLVIDEAPLTGESVPTPKDTEPLPASAPLGDRTSMLHAGTAVVSGRGRMVVTETGRATEVGRIATMVAGPRPKTPLEVDLAMIGRRITLIAGATAVVVFAVGIARAFPIETMALTAVALAVAAIPEGLPAVVTVSLAGGLQRMARRNAVVRRLAAVEALGAVDVICTDKTGTLTLPRLEVIDIVLADGRRGVGLLDPESDAPDSLALTMVLCNDAAASGDGWAGDPVEIALLEAARDAGNDVGRLRDDHPRIDEAAFDGKRKRMSTVHSVGGGHRLLVKGAPEVLISLSASSVYGDTVVSLDDAARENVLLVADELAAEGTRTLGFATKDLAGVPPDPARAEDDLTWVGLIALREEIRPEVPDSVASAARAGVRTVMVTGDHATTAESVATAVGLTDGKVMTGNTLASLSTEALTDQIREYRVFARVDPADKVKIVEAWQATGARVAMTGDGVNDAPALSRADIGVAMGSGTDVAREAASVVLADDNYTSIVAAIAEGRRLFSNLRNVVHYLLSANASEVLYVLLGFAFFGHLGEPLLAVQLLWINLVSDGLPAVALGADRPVGDMMTPDARIGRDILSSRNLTRLAAQGSALALAALGSLIAGIHVLGFDGSTARTMVFTTLVFSQLLHALSVRADSAEDPGRPGPGLLLALGGSALIHLALIYTPVGERFFRAVALDAAAMAWATGAAVAATLMVRVINRLLPRP